MKKIITASEQWMNDVNASCDKYGEFDNISYHKIEDDGIGIINDNEMYHFDEGGMDDVFYIKVGDKYSKVVCPVSSETLVANNYRKIDLDAAWIDVYKLMEWLHCSDVDGNYEEEVETYLHIQMYELIWMGVYGSECTVTTYEDKEIDTPDEPTDEEVIDALKKEQTDILCNNYPLGGDGMYCYYVNSEYYVSVIVEHEWDMFAWRIYTKNGGKDKLIASDFSCGLNEDTWLEVFKTDICGFTGTIEAMIELPSSIFNHVINA